MSRGLVVSLALLAGGMASAGVWKKPSEPFTPPGNHAVWDEYGLQEAEKASLGKVQAVVYRFKDTTGAYAAYDWVKAGDRSALLEGNLVFTCSGPCSRAELLPNVDAAAISHANGSTLPDYLPAKNRLPGSERYILGGASLAEFASALPPQAVAFQFSTEAVLARYREGAGDSVLAILSYPTPDIARLQADEFRKLSGAVVKRSGPMVMVISSPADPDAAKARVAGIRYQAQVSWDEKPPDPRFMSKLKQMLWAIGQLILFLVCLCVVGGLTVGGVRAYRDRFGTQTAGDAVIVLHLVD